MQAEIFQRLGRFSVERTQSSVHVLGIVVQSLKAFLRLAFLNHAVFQVTMRQIYYTAVEALPVVMATALILGSLAVNYILAILEEIGVPEYFGEYLVKALLHEMGPIFCTLLIMLRSGTTVISEVSFMKINHELDALHRLNIPIADYVFLPRIIAFAFAGLSLTLIFSLVGLIGGFLIMGYIHGIAFDNYMSQMLEALELRSLIIVFTKPIILSVAVAGVSLQRAIIVQKDFVEVPFRMIQGMMHLVGIIVMVEILYGFFY